MEEKSVFYLEVLHKKRFWRFYKPLSEEDLEKKRVELEQKYGGHVRLIETPVYVYLPYTTKDGSMSRRPKLLEKFLQRFKLVINHLFSFFSH